MRDKEFYTRASLNNTFDIKAVENALNDIQISSFQYLNEIQMQSTGLKRFDFKMSDLIRTERIDHNTRYYPRKWVYNIPENFIAENKRLEFRRSKFYNKFITFKDTIDNTNIFTNTFLLFIDGAIMNNAVELYCREDKTVVVFRVNEKPADSGINRQLLNRWIEEDVNVTFFMVSIEVGGSKTFNQYTFAPYNNVVPLKEFGIPEGVKYNNKFMVSVSNIGDIRSNLCMTDNTDENIFFLNNDIAESGYKSFVIDIFNLRSVDEIKYIEGNEEWFTIDVHECPVSTQNIVAFDYDTNRFLHDVKFELYYPNIYHVIGNSNNKKLKVYIFYYDDTSEKLLEYSNHLAVYYKYVQNVLDKYKNNTINSIIKNYMPVEVEYTINNFKETIWFDDAFKFKSEYLRELIVADGNNFRAYLKRQCSKQHSFYLPMKNVDLQSKIRQNNKDVNEPIWYEEFNELRYMFIFRNEFRSTFTDILFSIDGIAYIPDKHYKTQKYEYFYIPCNLINENSILEVEKIKGFLREELTTFTSTNDEKIFNIKSVDEITDVFHNDIFLTNAETDEYLNDDDYTVSVKLDNEWIDVNNDCFYKIEDQYKVKINNSDYLNKPLRIHIKKNYAREIHRIETEEQKFTLLTFSFDINKDPRHIRLYKNGRVIPRNEFEVIFNSNKTGGMSYVSYPREFEVGDEYVIEAVPYKMKEVYYSKFNDVNKIIDLYGIIDKPLDVKWYDFYLNGKKLLKSNIEIISPCKMILRDVQSSKNLSIVQNDRDDKEWYGFYSPTDIIDKILKVENFIDPPDNKDDEPDIITPGKDDEEDLLYDFWIKFLSKFGFINPDWSQIPESIVKWYNGLFIKPNNVFLIQPDRGAETAEFLWTMNPDVKKDNNVTAEEMVKLLRSF